MSYFLLCLARAPISIAQVIACTQRISTSALAIDDMTVLRRIGCRGFGIVAVIVTRGVICMTTSRIGSTGVGKCPA